MITKLGFGFGVTGWYACSGAVKMNARGLIAEVSRETNDAELAVIAHALGALPKKPFAVWLGANESPSTFSRSMRLVIAGAVAPQNAFETVSPLPRAQSVCNCAAPVGRPASGSVTTTVTLPPPEPPP